MASGIFFVLSSRFSIKSGHILRLFYGAPFSSLTQSEVAEKTNVSIK